MEDDCSVSVSGEWGTLDSGVIAGSCVENVFEISCSEKGTEVVCDPTLKDLMLDTVVGFSVLNNDEAVGNVELFCDISLVDRLEVSCDIAEDSGVLVCTDSSRKRLEEGDTCVTVDAGEDFSVLYNDVPEKEELVTNRSGVVSPDP